MSPRRHRRIPEPDPEGSGSGGYVEHVDHAPDGDWVVRAVTGAAATKTYRCPGCDHQIPPGAPHIVSWPLDTPGVAERRHWHTPCWLKRLDRRQR